MGLGVAGARLLDLIFPRRCVACRRSGGILCARCIAQVHAPQPPLCVHCGTTLASGVGAAHLGSVAGTECVACRSGHGPTALDAVRAAARYEDAARAAIIALKYERVRAAADPLGALLAEAYTRQGWKADLLVPMPLGTLRHRERGYNQAELLARRCGHILGLPVLTDVLVRARETAPQVRLSRDMRRSNVAGAFALASGRAASQLTGRCVLMIDDVTTTGSTFDAAAAALRTAQPAAIWGLAVARADLGRDGAHGRAAAPAAAVRPAPRKGTRTS